MMLKLIRYFDTLAKRNFFTRSCFLGVATNTFSNHSTYSFVIHLNKLDSAIINKNIFVIETIIFFLLLIRMINFDHIPT